MTDDDRTRLLMNLSEQLQFLRASGNAFDAGYAAEAKRIAVSIRVLVHDTRNSRSLLSQLGVKDQTHFWDYAPDDPPGNLLPYSGLLLMRLSVGGEASGHAALPRLDNGATPPKLIKFESWWHAVVIRTIAGQRYTRRDLILGAANKDGGAHVDPTLD